ncbi:stage III sporulation protein AG [Virgibacillus dokdonensis]|uniref:Stage III sporulation protein AG n=2 Tax=Virgibacillus TaxID=84406 RepID=A0A1M5LRR0_9BACI|nr:MULTISPECIES: stage III sporulation protein AG [Virgibacillus]RFA37147.1 stage III sporulation protein AG [Virgibacillus dokdonensis]SHG67701.1 stage III sporulation protein AG [Virgibacillus chiguensis]
MIEKLKEFFQKDGKKPPKKWSYMIILALVSVMLLIIGNIFSTSSETDMEEPIQQPTEQVSEPNSKETASPKEATTSNIEELESVYTKDLQTLINKIQGVSEAEVMVNLESTSIKVYEKNLIKGQQTTEETDTNGGTREIEDGTEETQTVLVRQGEKEVPLLIQTKKPEVRGVFVVAKGADHATVKKWIVEAVSRVLDVPTHRVSVMPKN